MRQLAALFLIAVFVFIHIVKVFHSHGNLTSHQVSKNTDQVKKSGVCFICDYHFTKDNDHVNNFHAANPQFQNSAEYIFRLPRTTSSIGLVFSDRGPPFLTV